LGVLPGLPHRALAVDLVVAEEVRPQVLERDALDVAPGPAAGGDLPLTLPEQAHGVRAIGAPRRLLDAAAAGQGVADLPDPARPDLKIIPAPTRWPLLRRTAPRHRSCRLRFGAGPRR